MTRHPEIFRLQGVLVNRLDQAIKMYYYAQLRIRHGGRLATLDVRPSDAFILAVILARPILISAEVLARIFSQDD